MSPTDPAHALRLIEQAVLSIQGRYSPGRPMYYAMARLHDEVRKARREAEAASRPTQASAPA